MSARGAVASPHFLASIAGLRVLEDGGNALDAAIATNLTLGVVAPYTCGFGGDLFALVWVDGAAFCYMGAGPSPAAASLAAVRTRLGDERRIPPGSALSVTVPGAVEAWFALLERFGTRSFGALAARALAFAREGFPVTRRGAASFAASARAFGHEPEWSRIYGSASPGAMLRQPDLARTIETLAEHGPDAYYRGAIARAIVDELRARGGLMELDDLSSHAGEWAEPMRARYRDVEVLELPPPTQGIAALQMASIADGLSLSGLDLVEREHLLIESAKLAMSELGRFVTDPLFMTTSPDVLLEPGRIGALRNSIDPVRAGDPRRWGDARGGTAYMCAADANGMCVSLIQSNWMGFGSGITVPGWGINLHNRGNLFSLDEADANVIAARKRTMHTIIPALALRDGEPWLVFGSMGGTGQAQTHLQMLVRAVDDELSSSQIIAAPRWVVTPFDWSVAIEARAGDDVIEGLRARGHRVHAAAPYDGRMGHANLIRVSRAGNEPATDPRTEGAALVVR